MKKFLLYTILMTFTSIAQAEWLKLVEDKEMKLFVETNSIKKLGNIVTYWELFDYSNIQSVNEKQYYSKKIKKELNCNAEEYNTLTATAYSENMGFGKVVQSYKYDSKEFEHIIPETIGYRVYKFVCNKK
jgi:hypothetical protein